jgi:hypothetical protein
MQLFTVAVIQFTYCTLPLEPVNPLILVTKRIFSLIIFEALSIGPIGLNIRPQNFQPMHHHSVAKVYFSSTSLAVNGIIPDLITSRIDVSILVFDIFTGAVQEGAYL